MHQAHKFSPTILRKYDIRGTIGETLSTEDAYYIGLSYGSLMRRRGISGDVAVAYDGRISSPSLAKSLIDGLNQSGVQVVNIGLAATPVLYFAVATLNNMGGGIMITGSHNPANQNGFKMIMGGAPFFDQDILHLGTTSAAGDFMIGDKAGACVMLDISEQYSDNLLNAHQGLLSGKPLKAVWDPGNGVVGKHLPELIKKLPGEHHLINTEVDGTFPSHHPNPTVVANLQQLITKVKATDSDLGFAFDGDGDRLGVVDKLGNVIWGDSLLLIMAKDLLSRHPGSKIIADVKTGDWVFREIKRMGGVPIIWKTGHSFIKTKMKQESCMLAGEMSGHLFFGENYYGFDDAIFAAVKLMDILTRSQQDITQIIASMPKMIGTPEISINSSEEKKFLVVEELKSILNQNHVEYLDIDGIRVAAEDGWWLVRASNTEANLILRIEARSEEHLNRLITDVVALLAAVGVKCPLLLDRT
jgi:phosphomannomutase